MSKRTSVNEKPVEVNAALRQWTRGVSFTLAMGKTQVLALIAIDLSREQAQLIGGTHPAMRHFVSAGRGLIDRGLVVHHGWTNAEELRQRKVYREFWAVTEAGEHVVSLLKLTGVYQELQAELERPDAQFARTVLRYA